MNGKQNQIRERSAEYALKVVGLFRAIEKDSVGRILGRQLLRSGTSIGANIEEAQGAQSRADFIAKMSISYKEARETAYWLRLIQRARITSDQQLLELRAETEEIIKILAAILITSKQKRKSHTGTLEVACP